jgi:hypothetical protein
MCIAFHPTPWAARTGSASAEVLDYIMSHDRGHATTDEIAEHYSRPLLRRGGAHAARINRA